MPPFATDRPLPTPEELSEILLPIQGTSFSIRQEPGSVRCSKFPGTGGLLYVLTNASGSSNVDCPDNQKQKETRDWPPVSEGCKSTHSKGDHNTSKCKSYKSGLYSRPLKTSWINVRVYISMKRLVELRSAALDREARRISDAKHVLEVRYQGANAVESRLCSDQKVLKEKRTKTTDNLNRISILRSESDDSAEEINLLQRKADLEKSLEETKAKLLQCVKAKEELAEAKNSIEANKKGRQRIISTQERLKKLPTTSILISETNEVLMIADTSKDLRIPVDRAWIGQTTNDLQFRNGILVNFHREQPAEMQVLSESLVTVTQTLFDGLIEVLRIPITVLGIQADEAVAETTLVEKRTLLQNQLGQLRTAEIETLKTEVDYVLQQAKLAEIQSDPSRFLQNLDNTDDEAEDDGQGEQDNAPPDATEDPIQAQNPEEPGLDDQIQQGPENNAPPVEGAESSPLNGDPDDSTPDQEEASGTTNKLSIREIIDALTLLQSALHDVDNAVGTEEGDVGE